jgi:DNA-binding NtrC family response regulator
VVPDPLPAVFVVDDEAAIASSLAAILKMHGYPAMSFTSPQEALAAARSKAPALLISDVMMPGLSGVDLAIQIRTECPYCKVLLFSGQATTQDLLEDARRRGYDFRLLQKPVHPDQMLANIRALAEENDLPGAIPVPLAAPLSSEAP